MRTKIQNYYVNNDYAMLKSLYKAYVEFDTEHTVNTKSSER